MSDGESGLAMASAQTESAFCSVVMGSRWGRGRTTGLTKVIDTRPLPHRQSRSPVSITFVSPFVLPRPHRDPITTLQNALSVCALA
ncbi:MAG: hypothetical protein RI954_738, partial [Actinomycetota bacterium]